MTSRRLPRAPLAGTARRAILAAALALPTVALPALVPAAQAQERTGQEGSGRIPRRIIFTAAGALTAALAASAFFFVGDDRSPAGMCSEKSCVVPLSIGAGALVGYMVGREFDQLHALRFRGGAPLKPTVSSVAVPASATELAVAEATLAVGGANGVQLVTSGDALKLGARRASGVRGIAALGLAPAGGPLAVGSPAGFYLYPPATGPGTLVRDGAVASVAASAGRMFVGTTSRIEVVPANADSARGSWPGVDVGSAPHALAFDSARSVLWALVDTSLVALRPDGDSLAVVSRTPVGGRGLRLSLLDDRVAVALGERGVALFQAADPASPRELGRWTGARFAYDVSLAWRRLYVASGVEGVYVLDTGGAGLKTEGLARELGFAIALVSGGGYTFVLDRTTNSLRRFASDF
jgi:hypothetical protein